MFRLFRNCFVKKMYQTAILSSVYLFVDANLSCLYLLFNAALLSLKWKKSTTKFSRRCSKIACGNFFQITINPDHSSAICNECMWYILKWHSYRTWDSMRYMLRFCSCITENCKLNCLDSLASLLIQIKTTTKSFIFYVQVVE